MAESTKASRLAGKIIRRVAKPIPIIGTLVALATATAVLRRKGVMRGGLDVALDATPLVGTIKGAIEFIAGDLIPERPRGVQSR